MTTVLVSALIDIGREIWQNKWARPFDTYLKNLKNVCLLDNYLVIWITEDLVETVKEFRAGKEEKTSIQTCTIEDFCLYKYMDRFNEIVKINKTRNWVRQEAVNAVEYTIPLYNIIMNNKVDFIRRTKDMHIFPNVSQYVWIDAGYTHGSVDFTNKHVDFSQDFTGPVYINRIWRWEFITDWEKFVEEWPWDVVDGGFIAFKEDIIDKFHSEYYALLNETIDRNIFDDDQFYMAMLFVRHPDMFSLREGDWFDAANRYIKMN